MRKTAAQLLNVKYEKRISLLCDHVEEIKSANDAERDLTFQRNKLAMEHKEKEIADLKVIIEAQRKALDNNRLRNQQLDVRVGIATQALVFIAAGHGELRGNEGRTQLYAAEQLAIIGATPITVGE